MRPLLLASLSAFVLLLVHGAVLKTLWGWFIVKQFGLPPIALGPAIGICIIVAMLTATMPKKSDEPLLDEISRKFNYDSTVALVALVVGFIVSLFV